MNVSVGTKKIIRGVWSGVVCTVDKILENAAYPIVLVEKNGREHRSCLSELDVVDV